jgi:hypothetical protein
VPGSSVTPAATAAATPAVDSGDLVNVAAGSPAAEGWPGAVDPSGYTDAGPAYPIEGPPYGSWFAEPFATVLPEQAPAGGIQDTSWQTGHDGPQAAWDSSAGAPFAPSGPAPAELHAEDTGAVYANQHVVPAEIGQLRRETRTGQTWNREYAFDAVDGQNVPARNDRVDFDQRQPWDPAPGDGGGYAPWDPGYAERPIQLNVAYEATPVSESGMYGLAGGLPDRSPYQAYAASAYEAPPDPIVNQPPAPAGDVAGGWLLG